MSFKPTKPTQQEIKYVNFAVTIETFNRIGAARKKHGLSIAEFCKQAVEFAIDEMDKP